ncbi:uncharacterized protein LOC141707417 [Apium graveolens]|uniref:uncharacterized protein LOC141707417 n=1 Tax=Apium graveolens TaxID=4045 RepID=UPI003D7A86B1
MQTNVERQDHAPINREVEGVSSSSAAVLEEKQEQQTGHLRISHPEDLLGTTLPTVILRPQQVSFSQTIWNHNAYFQQQVNSLQHSKNALSEDGQHAEDARSLHGMQLELQRSVRREVSAALNWKSRSEDWKYLVPDESNLEHVKNGVCCICCDAKILFFVQVWAHMCMLKMCREAGRGQR